MNTFQSTTEDFLVHCQFEKTLSPKTLKAYRTDLLQLTAFLTTLSPTLEVSGITKHHLREFLISIAFLKPKSIKRKVATVKAMFNYLEFEDKILVNPLRKMRIKIKEPKTLPSVMDLQEVVRIFKAGYSFKENAKDRTKYSYNESIRNLAVLELLFSTGARVSEIASLTTENINLHTGNVIIKGKGNKERVIQICNKESIMILKSYSLLFEAKIKASGGWFLINRFNKPLSDQSIRRIVKKIADKAGITKHITPHIFRHSFATLLLEKDVDIKYIQSLLGHSSINTTQIYTHVNRKRQRQILSTKHPRRDFSMHLSDA